MGVERDGEDDGRRLLTDARQRHRHGAGPESVGSQDELAHADDDVEQKGDAGDSGRDVTSHPAYKTRAVALKFRRRIDG